MLLLLVPAGDMAADWRLGNFGMIPTVGFIYWSGVWATGLLLVTLAIAPLARIVRWNGIVAVRRIVGVGALTYSLVHLAAYFLLHKGDWAMMAGEIARRPTLIVASAALLGFLCLGVTSNDTALRWLGGRAWKQLHRANYALTFLAVLHYLLSPGIFTWQYVAAGMLFWLLAWRVLDRRGLGADLRALAGLGGVTIVITVAIEAIWMRLYQQEDVDVTLAANLSFDLGLPASWQVSLICLGLLAAALGCRAIATR